MKVGIAVFGVVLALGCSSAPAKQEDETVMAKPAQLDVVDEAVQFEAAGMTIHGTISRPAGDGPFPAIAISAGSGPTDRDWRNPIIAGPNGSGALLAGELARSGVVTLRYDKRGTGETGMPTHPIVWGDYAAELSAAVQVLGTKPYVNPSKIYVAGHSEGGVHALRVAQAPPIPLGGVVLLSAAGRSLRDIVIWQISNQLKSALTPDAAQTEIDALTKAVDEIAGGTPVDARQVGSMAGLQQFLVALQNPQSIAFARELLKFDPVLAFSEFDLPVLIISGDRDIQVDPELDAAPLAAASKAAGRQTTVVIIEEADHVLKLEKTPRAELTPMAGASYNAADRVLNPELAPAIVRFLND